MKDSDQNTLALSQKIKDLAELHFEHESPQVGAVALGIECNASLMKLIYESEIYNTQVRDKLSTLLVAFQAVEAAAANDQVGATPAKGYFEAFVRSRRKLTESLIALIVDHKR